MATLRSCGCFQVANRPNRAHSMKNLTAMNGDKNPTDFDLVVFDGCGGRSALGRGMRWVRARCMSAWYFERFAAGRAPRPKPEWPPLRFDIVARGPAGFREWLS